MARVAQNEMEATRGMPVRVCSTEGLGAGLLHMNCVVWRSRRGSALSDWDERPPFLQEGRGRGNLLTELVFSLRRCAAFTSWLTHKIPVFAICFDQILTELVFTAGSATIACRSARARSEGRHRYSRVLSGRPEAHERFEGARTERLTFEVSGTRRHDAHGPE